MPLLCDKSIVGHACLLLFCGGSYVNTSHKLYTKESHHCLSSWWFIGRERLITWLSVEQFFFALCVCVHKGYYSCSTFLDSTFVFFFWFFFLVLFYIHAFVSLSLFTPILCGWQGYRLTCFKACLLLPQSLSHLLRRELANPAFAGMVWAMMVWK
jgi:hypothetical protein